MNRIIVFLFFSYVVFAAFLQIPGLMQYDSKRIFQLILFLLVGLTSLFYLLRSQKADDGFNPGRIYIRSRITFICLGVIFIFGLISVFLASNIKLAFLEFSLFFLILTLVCVVAPVTLKQHYLMGKFIFGAALLYSTIYIILFFGNYISSFFNPMIAMWPEKYNFIITINDVDIGGKEVLYFDHNRFFNHTQTWTLPILLGLLTYYQGIKNNKQIVIALISLITCWWMLIFASGGRGTIVGIAGALILLLIVCKKDAIPFLKNGVITFSLGSLIYFIFFRLLITESSGVPILRDSDSGRFGMWERAMEMWMQSPLFGAGPLHYTIITTEPYFAHPHNFYIQILTEWGLLVFIVFAALCFIFIKMIYRNYFYLKRNSSNRTIYLVFIWSILAAFIHAFFSGVLHTPMSQIWFILILAWLLGFQRYNFTSNKLGFNKNYIHIVYIVLLTILCWIVSDDILTLASGYSEYFSKYPESELYPRFWIQGLFK